MGRSVEENVDLAERLAQNNGGVLPTVSQIRRRGYHGLYFSMLRYPKMYKHLKRSTAKDSYRAKKKNTLHRYEALAMKLCIKGTNNELPSKTALRKRGHSNLVAYILKHPESFAKFSFRETNRGYITLQERVIQAETIAQKNGGVLPPTTVLIEKYGIAFYKATRRHKELFEHIPKSTHDEYPSTKKKSPSRKYRKKVYRFR